MGRFNCNHNDSSNISWLYIRILRFINMATIPVLAPNLYVNRFGEFCEDCDGPSYKFKWIITGVKQKIPNPWLPLLLQSSAEKLKFL